MRFWHIPVALVLLSGLAWTGTLLKADAQDNKEPVEMKFKAFDKGAKAFYQRLETKTTQKMTVGSQEMTQDQTQVFIIEWTPMDGGVVKQKITGVMMNINIGNTKIAYRSDNQEPTANPMTEFFKALMGVELKLTVNDKREVTKIDGRDDFVKTLGESHPQMKNLLKNILSEKALIKMSEQTWAGIPTGSKKVGEEWDGKSELDLGPIGKYTNVYKYKYEGREKDKSIKVSIKPKMEYAVGTSDKGELPFLIKSGSTLTSDDKESSGFFLFDEANGRIASSEMKMVVNGKIIVEIGGMDTTVKLEQTQISKSSTSDTAPKLSAN